MIAHTIKNSNCPVINFKTKKDGDNELEDNEWGTLECWGHMQTGDDRLLINTNI